MTVTLHSTAQYTESTALPNYGLAQAWLKPGSSLAQGTRNSTDAVRRCTETDRLAWVKTRSWLTLHCLVDLKVNLTLRTNKQTNKQTRKQENKNNTHIHIHTHTHCSPGKRLTLVFENAVMTMTIAPFSYHRKEWMSSVVPASLDPLAPTLRFQFETKLNHTKPIWIQ